MKVFLLVVGSLLICLFAKAQESTPPSAPNAAADAASIPQISYPDPDIGATVRVHAAGQTYTRYNDGKSGYLSQSQLPLYFGLGDAEKIAQVEIDWPSGRKQMITEGLKVNDTLWITEPGPPSHRVVAQ